MRGSDSEGKTEDIKTRKAESQHFSEMKGLLIILYAFVSKQRQKLHSGLLGLCCLGAC